MVKRKQTLIADIGATNARIALTSGKSFKKTEYFSLDQFDSIESLLKYYLDNFANKEISKGILGVAAPVLKDRVEFVNTNISFSKRALQNRFFKEDLIVLNDLVLQAYALQSIRKNDLLEIGNIKSPQKKIKILVVPGTGLGVSGIVGDEVVPSEAGHLEISYSNDTSFLLEKFAKEFNRPATYEDFLSGKGVKLIYRIIANEGRDIEVKSEDILNEVRSPESIRVKELLNKILADYLRSLALIWGSTGGIFLAGSLIESLFKNLDHKLFRKNFENNEKMMKLLSCVPIYQVKKKDLGLIGALNLSLID